jgi:ABC-type transporter Mla subunit MlaD
VDELKDILRDMAEKLDELQKIRANLVTLVARLDSIEPELTSLKRVAEAAASVAAETHGLVNELHTKLIETADRHGARLYALEHAPNGKAQ